MHSGQGSGVQVPPLPTDNSQPPSSGWMLLMCRSPFHRPNCSDLWREHRRAAGPSSEEENHCRKKECLCVCVNHQRPSIQIKKIAYLRFTCDIDRHMKKNTLMDKFSNNYGQPQVIPGPGSRTGGCVIMSGERLRLMGGMNSRCSAQLLLFFFLPSWILLILYCFLNY